MAGTVNGGRAASLTNMERYGKDFYKRIGAIGGKKGRTGGFAANKLCTCSEFAYEHYQRQCAGARGGRISRRGKKVTSE